MILGFLSPAGACAVPAHAAHTSPGDYRPALRVHNPQSGEPRRAVRLPVARAYQLAFSLPAQPVFVTGLTHVRVTTPVALLLIVNSLPPVVFAVTEYS
jgi:hypothetical protein